MRRNKRWFGPMRSLFKVIVPVSWEGYAVTVALVLGVGLLKLEGDPVRRAIALALIVAAFGAIVFLTWSDDDSD